MIKTVIKSIITPILIAIIIFPYNSNLNAQGFLKVQGTSIVDSTGNNVLLRGFGLGGWMVQEGYMLQIGGDAQYQIKNKIVDLIGEDDTEKFYEAWRDNHCRKVDIDSLASWGFNSVRLPMHYNLFTLPIEDEPVAGTSTFLETGFTMVDSLLDWCAANEMYLILDLHAAPGGQGYDQAISDYDPTKPSLWQSAENRTKTVALWGEIARRYAHEPWIGGYDLINETNWNLPGNSALKTLYLQITDAIRQVDTTHIIFIEGNWFANDFTGLTPPWDNNMVYSFHKYWSYNNQASIQWMINIRNSYNRPIWCGESGENSNVWFTDAIRLFEANNIGWAWWPVKKIESIAGPLSVKKTPEYKVLLDYWDNSGPRPSALFAYNALMDLTDKLKIENCEFNKDVIDAMIRQARSNETIPFAPNKVPGIINVVDFDYGRNRYSYFANDEANYSVSGEPYTAWNEGWSYRNDAVGIELSDDAIGFDYSIGWTEDGEWLKYTLNVTETDSYKVFIRVATELNNSVLRLSIDNDEIARPITISSTGGWKDWQTIEVGSKVITSGNHSLKLDILRGGVNINQIQFIDPNATSETSEKEVVLYQNFPNPCNPGTTITFKLIEDRIVNLSLYNTLGQKVKTLLNEYREAGVHPVKLSVKDLASGVYFYKISTTKSSDVMKLIVLR